MAERLELWAWRHPRPIGAEGRCIGRTDLAVDRRRVKRLARRIAATARRENLPREVWTSPSKRCADVGRLLKRRGFTHRIDERLCELDFGAWDGLHWDAIAPADVARWEADFAHHRPGGGESLAALTLRARAFLAERTGRVLIVGHGGWINAMHLPAGPPSAAHWPPPIAYGSLLRRVLRASLMPPDDARHGLEHIQGGRTQAGPGRRHHPAGGRGRLPLRQVGPALPQARRLGTDGRPPCAGQCRKRSVKMRRRRCQGR